MGLRKWRGRKNVWAGADAQRVNGTPRHRDGPKTAEGGEKSGEGRRNGREQSDGKNNSERQIQWRSRTEQPHIPGTGGNGQGGHSGLGEKADTGNGTEPDWVGKATGTLLSPQEPGKAHRRKGRATGDRRCRPGIKAGDRN